MDIGFVLEYFVDGTEYWNFVYVLVIVRSAGMHSSGKLVVVLGVASASIAVCWRVLVALCILYPPDSCGR
jgi:hypothetical protein